MTQKVSPFSLKLWQKGLIIIMVPLFLGIMFITLLWNLLSVAEQEAHAAMQAKEVVSAASDVYQSIIEVTRTLSVFLVTRNSEMEKRFQTVLVQMPKQTERLEVLTKQEREVQEAARKLTRLQTRLIHVVTTIYVAAKQSDYSRFLMALSSESTTEPDKRSDNAPSSNREPATTNEVSRENDIPGHAQKQELSITEQPTVSGLPYLHGLRRQLNALLVDMFGTIDLIKEHSSTKATKFSNEESRRNTMKAALQTGLMADISISIVLILYFAHSITGRLKTTMENTSRLAENRPLLPVLTGRDEIATLDQVFHKMAAALERAARKERAIIDNAVDVICSLDQCGRFLSVSPASTSMWGYTPEELVNQPLAALLVSAEPSPCETSPIASFHQGCIGVSNTPVENRLRRSDGSIVDLLWSSQWADEQTLYCVAHDITQRKQSEEIVRENEQRFRLITEYLPIGLIILNQDGMIEFSNGCASKMFQCNREALIGQPVGTLFEDKGEIGITHTHLKALAFNEVTELTARRILTHSHFPAEVLLGEFQLNSKTKHLLLITDVTEKHEIERLKQEFLSMVSHDLRTPLTSIMAMLSLISNSVQEAPARVKELATMSEREARRLVSLINDLLDLEKMESGRFEMCYETVDLPELIEQAVTGILSIAEHKGITIEVNSLDIDIEADGARLLQVLNNLLSNAVKFSPPNSSISVTCAELNDMLEVRIRDQGRGIDQIQQQRIFERYTQIEIGDSREKGGSGLGLAICKAILEEHGGQIGVSSEPGQGSTFWFRVPLTQPADTHASQRNGSQANV